MKINSTLDMWSPQQKGEEIFFCLEGIDNKSKIILFTNIESVLNLGEYSFKQKFKFCIWVKGQIIEDSRIEKQGRLIICLENAPFTQEIKVSDDFIIREGTKLDEKLLEKIMKHMGLDYIKLESKQESLKKSSHKLDKEVWFIRSAEVLEQMFGVITSKQVKLYSNVNSKLTLKYYENPETGYLIDQRDFLGLLEFSDKLAILVKPTTSETNKYKNSPEALGYEPIDLDQTKHLLTEQGFNIEIINGMPNIEIESKINSL